MRISYQTGHTGPAIAAISSWRHAESEVTKEAGNAWTGESTQTPHWDRAETPKAMASALKACEASVATWEGDFPFERALDSVGQWKPGQAPLGR